MSNRICQIHDCDQPAKWHTVLKGHPNGDIDAWYCAGHTRAYAWDESPKPYEIRISGPYPTGQR